MTFDAAQPEILFEQVPRGVAMSITGHKAEAVFERYNITDTADIRDALIRVGQYAKMQERAGRKRAAAR
jgi:hypothetical protein